MKRIACVEARPFAASNPAQMERLQGRPDLEVLDCRGKTVDEPAFLEQLKKAEVVISGNDLRFTQQLLAELPSLKLISKIGAGLDMIDIPAATAHGVMVCNTPGANSVAVAEHTFALLLGYLRQVIRCDSGMRRGLWEETAIMGHEICGKTLGIIGLGSIGRDVARRAVAFEARVVAQDPFWPAEFAARHGIEQMSLEGLLKISDFVCVHCPLTKETANSIGLEQISLMKPEAVLVNMARGGIVNDADLYRALLEKRISGAILDAFAQEPPTDLPFARLDNVLLSPHVGAFTYDAMEKMARGAVDNAFAYLDGGRPESLRNPEAVQ